MIRIVLTVAVIRVEEVFSDTFDQKLDFDSARHVPSLENKLMLKKCLLSMDTIMNSTKRFLSVKLSQLMIFEIPCLTLHVLTTSFSTFPDNSTKV